MVWPLVAVRPTFVIRGLRSEAARAVEILLKLHRCVK
jgi:hypothetical protein